MYTNANIIVSLFFLKRAMKESVMADPAILFVGENKK